MAIICAVVMNSVTRDARVLKEAESLAAAGHDVTIVGVVDKKFGTPYEELPSGVRIVRVHLAHVRTAIRHLLRGILATLVCALLVAVVMMDFTVQQLAIGMAVVMLAAVPCWFLYTFARAMNQAVANVPSGTGRGARLSPGVPGTPGAPGMLGRYRAAIGRALWFWLRLWPLAYTVRRMRPDVVHCHDIHTLPIGAYVRLRTGCRMVYDAHEIYEEVPQADRWYRFVCRLEHRVCLRFVDRFITINESIAAWYAKAYPRVPAAVIVMNATRKIEEPVAYDNRLHEAAGLAHDGKILLYQGGFATHRGLEMLVESAAHLPRNWYLVMMGWGRNEGDLRAIAQRVNDAALVHREDHPVRFLPPVLQKELPYWTSGASVGVIPYENTGLNHWFCTPNKLWEYPCAGVPILVSPFPEMRRMVETYHHGWLLPLEMTPEGIAQAICGLSDADIAVAKANTARFIAASHWDIYGERLVELYRELCGSSGAA